MYGNDSEFMQLCIRLFGIKKTIRLLANPSRDFAVTIINSDIEKICHITDVNELEKIDPNAPITSEEQRLSVVIGLFALMGYVVQRMNGKTVIVASEKESFDLAITDTSALTCHTTFDENSNGLSDVGHGLKAIHEELKHPEIMTLIVRINPPS